MFTPLSITLFLLAPAAAQQDLPTAAVQQPTAQESVPLLSDIPLLAELFDEQEPVPDPDLRWNGETEDIYRRAMHLIQVRAKYREGADLLLAIADSDQVIQIPGQASWVLAQAAIALARAGDTAEAEALLPGIVNGAAGTDLAPQVSVLTRRAQALMQTQQEQQPLDDTFRQFLWERLLQYPRTEQDRGSDITGYGRQTLPYLKEIIEGQLALGAAGHQSDIGQAKKAAFFGLRMADKDFAEDLYDILMQYPPLTTSVLLPSSRGYFGEDATAIAANSIFYLKLAKDRNADRVKLAENRLVQIGKRTGDASALDYLWSMALDLDADRIAPLHEAVLEGDLYMPEAWSEFTVRCAESAAPPIREAARWGMVGQPHHRDRLRRLAQEGAPIRDQLRYLASFLRAEAPGTNRGTRTPALEAASQAFAAAGFFDALPMGWQFSRLSPVDRTEVTRFAQSSDAAVANVAIAIVMSNGDDEFIEQVFASAGASQRESMLHEITASTRSGSWDYGPDAAQQLLSMAQAGSDAAYAVLVKESMQHLSVAELVASGLDWGAGSSDPWGLYLDRCRRADGGRESIADLLFVEGLEPKVRRDAMRSLLSARTAALRAIPSAATWKPSNAADGDVLFSEAYRLIIGEQQQRSATLPEDVPIDVVEDFIRVVWGAVRSDCATPEDSRLNDLLVHHWQAYPDRAYELALELVRSKEDLAVYLHRPVQGLMKNPEWGQRLASQLIAKGLWDLEVYPVYYTDASQPEFEPLMRKMFASDYNAPMAIHELGDAGQVWRDHFSQELAAAWRDPELAWMVVDELYLGTAEIKNVVSELLAAWELEGLENRARILGAMGETLDDRVVPVLLEQLGSPNERCRVAAKEGLERLREVREEREFWEAWEATGSSVSPAVALIQKLKSDNDAVRIAAIQSLGTMKAPEALPFLVDLLEDSNSKVRDAAVAALEKINAG